MKITPEGYKTLQPAGEDMKICAFLWSYYGYPNSNYEGVNVEVMRYKNGEIMARDEAARGTLLRLIMSQVSPIPVCLMPWAMRRKAAIPMRALRKIYPDMVLVPSHLRARKSETAWRR